MRAFGVDPGLTRCGFGMVDSLPGRRLSMVAVDVVRTPSTDPLDSRLLVLAEEFDRWIERWEPDALALERPFARRDTTNIMGTAQVMGAAIVCAARHGIPVAQHTPTEVKAAVTGSGTANKAQVQTMVSKLLGLAERPEPADAADALAIAICHLWRPSVPTASAQPGPGEVTPAQRAWMEAERAAGRRQ